MTSLMPSKEADRMLLIDLPRGEMATLLCKDMSYSLNSLTGVIKGTT